MVKLLNDAEKYCINDLKTIESNSNHLLFNHVSNTANDICQIPFLSQAIILTTQLVHECATNKYS